MGDEQGWISCFCSFLRVQINGDLKHYDLTVCILCELKKLNPYHDFQARSFMITQMSNYPETELCLLIVFEK